MPENKLTPLKTTISSLFQVSPETSDRPVHLMTWKEYLAIINKEQRWHPNSAYDIDTHTMNKELSTNILNHWNILIRQTTINGIRFQIRTTTNDRSCPIDYMICIFDMDAKKVVGAVQDEWGAELIRIAYEYRGFGLASIISDIVMKDRPFWPTGGLTSSGLNNARGKYRRAVKKALANGEYSRLVRSGQLQIERVKEILSEVPEKPDQTEKKTLNLSETPLLKCLLYTGSGDLCLYDPKLRMIFENQDIPDMEFWKEKFLLGHANTYDSGAILRLAHISGKTEKHARLMMRMALEEAKTENKKLFVPERFTEIIPRECTKTANPGLKYGNKGLLVELLETIELTPFFSKREPSFRKEFDVFSEFEIYMQESCNSMNEYKSKKQEELLAA